MIPKDTQLTPWPDDLKKWDKLTADEKKLFARQAEVFAAYTAYTDHEIGRVIQVVQRDRCDTAIPALLQVIDGVARPRAVVIEEGPLAGWLWRRSPAFATRSSAGVGMTPPGT